MNNDKISEGAILLPENTISKFHVRVKYVLMECCKCGHSWGVVVNPQQTLSIKDLICSKCATKEMAEKFSK